MADLKVLTVIPARKGSKGVPGKNKKLLNNKPLVMYSLEFASKLPSNYYTILSSDDAEILELGKQVNIDNNGLRPSHLSNDHALTLEVLNYELNLTEKRLNTSFDAVLLLQPTCPNRSFKHLENIENTFIKHNKKCSVVSVKRIISEHPFRMKRFVKDNLLINYVDQGIEDMRPRQELPPVYIRNGSVYFSPAHIIREESSMVTEECYGFEMDETHSINIDSLDDFYLAEKKLIT